MNLRPFALFIILPALSSGVLRAGPRLVAGRTQLEKDIAVLESRVLAARPEFEREQQAWEGEVLQQAGPKGPDLPPRILAILALEPSERDTAQREEVAAYFRPLSKSLGAITRQLAAKRAALAALLPGAPAHPRQ